MDSALEQHTRNPSPAHSNGRPFSADIVPGGLLDVPAARMWFDRIDLGRSYGLYTLGLPLDRASMAESGSGGSELVLFSCYSYLGLNGHPRILAAATEALAHWGTTAGGPRLLSGTLDVHRECEAELASFLGTAAAILYPSGYDANIGVMSALMGREDTIFIDERAHRSLYDGCRLSGARLVRFRHNDLDHLESLLLARAPGDRSRRLIAVDGVYSMDGDLAPLPGLVELKDRHGAFLLLDEAHALGVVGPRGRGTPEHFEVDLDRIDIITGSLAKSVPVSGGYAAGSAGLINFLLHSSASSVFTAGITPASAAAIYESLRVIVDEPEHRTAMWRNTERLRRVVSRLPVPPTASVTPIVPVILGDPIRTYQWARWLLEYGIYVLPVSSPAVPENQSLIRFCAMAGHTDDHFRRLETALADIVERDHQLPMTA